MTGISTDSSISSQNFTNTGFMARDVRGGLVLYFSKVYKSKPNNQVRLKIVVNLLAEGDLFCTRLRDCPLNYPSIFLERNKFNLFPRRLKIFKLLLKKFKYL